MLHWSTCRQNEGTDLGIAKWRYSGLGGEYVFIMILKQLGLKHDFTTNLSSGERELRRFECPMSDG